MAFWRLWYHLVWATKNREPLIQPEVEDKLYVYLAHKAKELGIVLYAINGWHDHIHLLVAISPKQAIVDVVKHLKGASAFYLNNTITDGSFGWQRGYGVLSLGQQQRAKAEEYIRNQKQHHQEQTTEKWLEYCAEIDEGPTAPLVQGSELSKVQEEAMAHDTSGGFAIEDGQGADSDKE